MAQDLILYKPDREIDFRVFYISSDGIAFERLKRARGKALVPYAPKIPATLFQVRPLRIVSNNS